MVFFFLQVVIAEVVGQALTSENLLTLSVISKSKKMDTYLRKNGFTATGSEQINDTLRSTYILNNPGDSVNRSVSRTIATKYSAIIYNTTSKREYLDLINAFRKAGFICRGPIDSLTVKPLLFQHHEYTVLTLPDAPTTTNKEYRLQVQSVSFPAPKEIRYADDLLVFSSHEFLEYYFGKENIKSDVYYFSDNQIARCSVLFLNTRRQVVFIWQDELNKCTIDHLLFGGQMQLKSSRSNEQLVAENSWVFKSGIRPGMSLQELRKLNGNTFNFYGGNAASAGLVIADSAGRLDFKKENVFLSCINCNDDRFFSSPLINADDALAQERVMFILSIALSPG